MREQAVSTRVVVWELTAMATAIALAAELLDVDCVVATSSPSGGPFVLAVEIDVRDPGSTACVTAAVERADPQARQRYLGVVHGDTSRGRR